MIRLGVNIDHIATLRQQRGTPYPDPVAGALLAVESGADGITAHLREDRRHIQDDDMRRLKSSLSVPLNFEMAASHDIVQLACEIKPKHCCLVPEKRKELTTEGGLDVVTHFEHIQAVCQELHTAAILVSLFIDAEKEQVDAANACGVSMVEIHTGHYADADSDVRRLEELHKIELIAKYANNIGLKVNAGHGLTIDNVKSIARIPGLNELNIGHGIISRAVFVGLAKAVREIKDLIIDSI